MTGASIETTLELWDSSLREVKARIRPLFTQEIALAGSAAEIAKGLDTSAWRRLSAGEGTKGARFCDWAAPWR